MTCQGPISARWLDKVSGRLSAFLREDRGATAALWALLIPAFIGFLGFTVDFGRIYQVKLDLQAASDAAALAGGSNLENNSAISTAISYGALSGKKNAFSSTDNVTISTVSGYPMLKCLSDTVRLGQCRGSELAGGANAIQVKQQAIVNTYFLGYIGRSSVTVEATATATARGGSGQPLDIIMIIDTTASMTAIDAKCGLGSQASRLNCALAGAQTVLSRLDPSLARVGIMIFPGLVNNQAVQKEFNCASVGGLGVGVAAYNGSPIYQITPLSNDFKVSASSLVLNSASNNVLATQNNAGCTNSTNTNMDAAGGVGTYYADVITAAQASLVASGKANTQRVIVILTDGSASASLSVMATNKSNNQCSQAVTAAKAAAATGTWIYSIAYGAATGNASCPTDTGASATSSCTTLQNIASDLTKFFSDAASGVACPGSNSVNGLVSLFSAISTDLSEPRLIPDNTT